jgi:hypothetical protein
MTRLEKCEYLKNKGYTYNPDTGKIYGIRGKEITNKLNGYVNISFRINDFKGFLLGHHYGWFMTYGNVDFEMLDHINQIKTDNRISNLRIVTNQENQFNTKAKGYCWHKHVKKWMSRIQLNGKLINLGYFTTEEEAREAYLNAKNKLHIIEKSPKQKLLELIFELADDA